MVSSSALLGLTERVSNIEQFTNLYGGMYTQCMYVCMYVQSFAGYLSEARGIVTTAPNLIKTLHFRRPQLQTKSFLFPISIDK